MKTQLVLYGTAGCHLCEQAESVLLACGLDWVNVDIADDEALLQAYGIRIPVLRRPDTNEVLDWPFSAADAARLAG